MNYLLKLSIKNIMKKRNLYCLCAAFLVGLSACESQEPEMTLNVDLASHEADVPSSMYGIFSRKSTMRATEDFTVKC